MQSRHDSAFSFFVKAARKGYMLHITFHDVAKLYKII